MFSLKWIFLKQGPFEVEVRAFEKCPPSKSGLNLISFKSKKQTITRKKYNLLLDVDLGFTVTSAYTVNANVAKKTPQGWKDNFFQLDNLNLCGAFKQFIPTVFEDVVTGLKLKRKDCPLPAGNYSDLLIRPTVDVKSIPAFVYSNFKLRGIVFNKTDAVGCIDILFETLPKRS